MTNKEKFSLLVTEYDSKTIEKIESHRTTILELTKALLAELKLKIEKDKLKTKILKNE